MMGSIRDTEDEGYNILPEKIYCEQVSNHKMRAAALPVVVIYSGALSDYNDIIFLLPRRSLWRPGSRNRRGSHSKRTTWSIACRRCGVQVGWCREDRRSSHSKRTTWSVACQRCGVGWCREV